MMFGRSRDPDSIRAAYLARGLPVELVGPRAYLLAGRRLGVISMPDRLGHRVIESLPDCGPVLGHPRSRRVAFVVAAPAPDPPLTLLQLLMTHAVVVVGPGRRIPVPAHDGTGVVVWVNEPRRTVPMPRQSVIIDAALRLSRRS